MLPAGLLPNPSTGDARPERTLGALEGAVLGRQLFTPKIVHEVILKERVPTITCCGGSPRPSISPSFDG